MEYISDNYRKEKVFYISENVGAYTETHNPKNENVVDVNIEYRDVLTSVLLPKSYINNDKDKHNEIIDMYKNSKKELFNLLIHYFCQIDMIRGLKYLDVVMLLEKDMILNGKYGDFAKEKFINLNDNDKNLILYYLARYDTKNQVDFVFYLALNKIFKSTKPYHEEDTSIVHIYIHKPQNSYNDNLYLLIEFLFKDINIDVEIMWEKQHFGLIGVDETMIINEIAIVTVNY